MATTSTLVSVSGSASYDHRDTVTLVYRTEYDAIPTNFYSALIAAQTGSGSQVPLRRTAYAGTSSSRLYVQSIDGAAEASSRSVWLWTVTFGAPPPGELNAFVYANPLERPPIYNVEYMDREYVIQKAKNVEALSHGDGKGGNRAANTLKPIVNGAGKRPDEPQMDTERLEVLVIRRSYPNLAAIVTQNRAFKRSTNSDALVGYQPRQLKYLLTESEGEQFENGVEHWPGVTTILAEDTTDLILDNVGYEYWDANAENPHNAIPNTDGYWIKLKDADGNDMAEPINLTIDGDQGGDNTDTITYRHLNEIPYAPLI